MWPLDCRMERPATLSSGTAGARQPRWIDVLVRSVFFHRFWCLENRAAGIPLRVEFVLVNLACASPWVSISRNSLNTGAVAPLPWDWRDSPWLWRCPGPPSRCAGGPGSELKHNHQTNLLIALAVAIQCPVSMQGRLGAMVHIAVYYDKKPFCKTDPL